MLDNGYFYPAATRLTVFQSATDWAMTIEVFGFSPRSGLPSTNIYTFAGKLRNRERPPGHPSYEAYLAANPHNELRSIGPIGEGSWIDCELVAMDGTDLTIRGELLPIPTVAEIKANGITLQGEPDIRVFELARYLAQVRRRDILATEDELRVNVGPELTQVLQIDEWNHPDVADEACRPSGSETFQQLAEVMVTGDARRYRPTLPPNTHWRNWPAGGTM